MKSYKLWQIFASLLLILSFQSCDKEDDTPAPIEITFNGITFTIPENPTNEQVIGELPASVNRGDLAFSLKDQDPAGAMAINPTSGQLTVLDASKFDFETNPTVTATAVATVEGVEKTATITVTITDVVEAVGSIPFITSWEITTANDIITIPTNNNFVYDYTIDWGDSTKNENVIESIDHEYAAAGTYTISITGRFPAIYFNKTGDDRNKLKDIKQWGNIEWESMRNAFRFCGQFDISATDAPDLSRVTSIAFMFDNAYGLQASINHWDVSNVTDMSYVFAGANNFNQPLDQWDVSKVTSMKSMFLLASKFNQDISGWNVSNVTNMRQLFYQASAFSQDLSGWDTSNVTSCNDFSSNSGLSAGQLPTAGDCL
jgi:surface protein